MLYLVIILCVCSLSV